MEVCLIVGGLLSAPPAPTQPQLASQAAQTAGPVGQRTRQGPEPRLVQSVLHRAIPLGRQTLPALFAHQAITLEQRRLELRPVQFARRANIARLPPWFRAATVLEGRTRLTGPLLRIASLVQVTRAVHAAREATALQARERRLLARPARQARINPVPRRPPAVPVMRATKLTHC